MYRYLPYHATSRPRTAVLGRGSEEACSRSSAAHTRLPRPLIERTDVARVDSIASHSKFDDRLRQEEEGRIDGKGIFMPIKFEHLPKINSVYAN